MAVTGKYNQYPVPPAAARLIGETPTESLRQFALAVHGTDDVPVACLLLQERFDLDVNVLLLAAYLGAARGQVLDADHLDEARALVDPWHREVVRPLRSLRQRLKSGPTPAPDPRTAEVRTAVKAAELDAEMIELDLLGDWAAGVNSATAPGDAAERALAAMHLVVSSYSTAPTGDDDRRALALIATAAARRQSGVGT